MFRKKLAKEIGLFVSISAASVSAFSEEWVMEEVMVTAQKRAQSMQEVGIAITAFSGDDVKKLNMATAKDIAAQTPGLYAANTQSGGIPVFAIRGVGLDDYNINNSSGVGVYVDEVFASSPVFLNFQLVDVERIEVLKGPQGTLYGKNTTGGAVSYFSNRPTEETEGYLSAEYGRYNRFELEGAVGGKLTENVNARVAVSYVDQQDGWQKDVNTGEEYGKEDKVFARVLLQYLPSDDLDVLINLHGGLDKSVSQTPVAPVSEAWLGSPPLDRTKVASSAIPERNEEGYGASVTINKDFEAFTLTSVTAWDTYNRNVFENYDGTSWILNDLPPAKNEADQVSQEIRLTSNSGGDFSWIVGANASQENASGDSVVAVGDAFSDGFMNWESTVNNEFDQEVNSFGLYVHTETDLNERWKLTAGARYSYDEVNFTASVVDSTNAAGYCAAGGFSSLGLIPAFCAVDLGILLGEGPYGYTPNDMGIFSFLPTGMEFINIDDSNDSDNLSGKLALNYLPNEDWLFYSSLATSYKGGRHFASTATTAAHLAYLEPEELISFEVGFKSTLLDGKLQLNGAAFMTEYENRQSVLIDENLVPFLGTVPESEIAGFEVDAWWRVTRGLEVKVGVAYLDSEITKAPTTADLNGIVVPGELKGLQLSQAPEWSYNGLVRYSFDIAGDLQVSTQLDYSWVDSQVSTLSDPEGRSEQVNSLGARIALLPEDGSWELALYGTNLTDESNSKWSFSNFWGDRADYFQQPTYYSVAFTYNFN